MRTLVRTLTSRGVSVALMAFIAGLGAIGAWVPQRVNVPPAVFARWQADNPLLSAAASALGLDRLFWSWWFAAILALFTVSLLVATARMTADAWRSTRPSVKAPQSVVVGATVQQVAERARACGYRERASAGDVRVFTRHRLGVWGPALMHAGMVVTVGAALASAAFTSRAVADLSAGEVFLGPEDYLVVDGGVWSTPPDLGRPWRLEGLDTGTWPDGSLKTLSARIGMAGDDGAFEVRTAKANRPLRAYGHVVYVQPAEFGDAAFLAVTTEDGTEYRVRMEFGFTPAGEVEYADVVLGDGNVVEGRWDPGGVRAAEPLALRLAGGDGEVVTLAPGDSAELGGYTATFMQTAQWARLIVARPLGVGVLFAGFGIIGLGSLILYLWVPRELRVAEDPVGVRYTFWAPRMGKAYVRELDEILGRAERTEA